MSGSGVLAALKSKGIDAHAFDPAERSLSELATEKFDRILLVDLPEAVQLARASDRDNTSIDLISEIIKNQASREQRLKYADDIIDNSVKIEELTNAVQKLHNKYLKLAEAN